MTQRHSAMLGKWRHAAVNLSLLIAAQLACSDATASDPPEKLYSLYEGTALFDGGSGTTTPFSIAIHNYNTATEQLLAAISFTDPASFDPLTDATLSVSTIRFRYVGDGLTWQFNGTLNASGEYMSGRHTRTTAAGAITGTWTAIAPAGLPPPVSLIAR